MPLDQITEDYAVISPAYGREYKNKAEVEKDFRSEKDFKMESVQHGDGYCSIRDFAEGVKVEIRYAKLTKCVIVTV